MRRHWTLDPAVAFLNHGSFGACPAEVLEAQQRLRARIEREPVRFFSRELEALLDEARAALAAFVGADAEDLAFVANATTGVATVLAARAFGPGDQILVTDHAYQACRNAVDRAAARSGARVVVARVPFPIANEAEAQDAVLAAATSRTRLALVDHVASPTALVFPIAPIVRALDARGIDVLVDGAHAPGMLPLDLRAIGAAYYTGNAHKWLCAPKGAAFLHVRRDRQGGLRPLVTSHGASSTRTDRSRFRLEFDWTGTDDPTAWLCVPEAIRVVAALAPGGFVEVMTRNHALALTARATLCRALGVPPPCPDAMIGSIAAVPLRDGDADSLRDALLFDHGIEVPIVPWPAPPRRLVRISAQLYNEPEEYQRLAGALSRLRAGA